MFEKFHCVIIRTFRVFFFCFLGCLCARVFRRCAAEAACGFSVGRSGFPSPTCSTSDQSAPVQNFILSSRRGTDQARIRTKPEKLWEKRQTTCSILNRTVCNTRDGSFMTHISPPFPQKPIICFKAIKPENS